jgi:hypothetical protein
MKMSIDLIALVKFNQGKAFVLKDKLELKYNKQDGLIIGLDDSCTFLDLYYYEAPSQGFKAFGGREFDITLENGEVIHCNGQWWSGGSEKASKLLGEEVISCTANDAESLKRCYVYHGYYAIKEQLEELARSYEGKFYEYYEFEKELKSIALA